MVLPSPYPDVEIPNLSVPEFVLAAGKQRPDAPALVDGLKGDVITHGQLAGYVDRVAAALHAKGLRKGDVVAVLCPNTPWYPVVFHGIAADGLVLSAIISLYTADEIAFQLKDSGARILITIGLFLDRAKEATEKPPVDEIVVLDGGRIAARGTHTELLARPGPYRTLWDLERGCRPPRPVRTPR